MNLDWITFNLALENHPTAIIRLSVPVDYSTDDYSVSVERINQLPPQVTHLSLVIWYPDPDTLSKIEGWDWQGTWEAWNQALRLRPRLKEVSILLCPINDYHTYGQETNERQHKLFAKMKHIAEAEFNEFSKRGALHIQDFDHHRSIYPGRPYYNRVTPPSTNSIFFQDSQCMISMESQRHLEDE